MHHAGRSVFAKKKNDPTFDGQYAPGDESRPHLIPTLSAGTHSLTFDARTRIAKRLLDTVIAVTGLVILSPVLVIVAVIIVLDSPGPVLFGQTRVGQDGRPFVMLKFRTMRPDRRKQAVGVPADLPERRQVHKSPNDPRTTRAGRFLRRSCLDEVPQLRNVLRGEMSLVGPRPQVPEIVAQYEAWQHMRDVVPPGITGWWQINRDGVQLMHEATHLDLYYVEHWAVGLDLQILLRTLSVVLSGVGSF
jgi:lipopolysaccharide/colanic/teichoic acid biosynthesis glycosyltransferase